MKFPAIVLALLLFAAGQGLCSDEEVAFNVYSVAKAAQAAGFLPLWKTPEVLVRTMEGGVKVYSSGVPILFKVAPLSESERAFALKHIVIKNKEPVWIP
jgi:hypothetical protein